MSNAQFAASFHGYRLMRDAPDDADLLDALLSLTDDAVVARSTEGLVMRWNAGAERLLGYTSQDVVGKPMWAIVPPDRTDEVTGLLERACRGEIIKHFQTVRVRKDGKQIDVSVDVAPIYSEDEIVGAAFVTHDISERVTSERTMQDAAEALQRADELKNTFLRTVSHDVRSPLTAVLSAAKLLEDGRAQTPEQHTQFSRMIVRNAHRIRRLLDDVLDIERLTRGDGLEPMREDVDVVSIVRAVLEELNSSSRTIDVDFAVETLFADRMQLERTVYNLVGNAIKHTDSDILVRTWKESDGVVFAVDDSGSGVPDDVKEAIFEPFRRATDVHTPGTGVGLSLVSEFARAHGGRAWVEDRPGGGSSFRVFFPDERKDEA